MVSTTIVCERSKKERGTKLFCTYASFHIVEKGKRITVFTLPVYQLDDHATICSEEIIKAAWIRGIKIKKLLIEGGFYSVDVMNMLERLEVEFLMPAIKNDRIKLVIVDYHNHLIPKMVKFKIRNSKEEEASFGLMIYKNKKDAKETDPIPHQYIVFATNMKYSEARKLYRKGSFGVQRSAGESRLAFAFSRLSRVMTTSQNYTIRIIYEMLSVIIYNLWQLAKHPSCSRIDSETESSSYQIDTSCKNIQNGDRDASLGAEIITFGCTVVSMGFMYAQGTSLKPVPRSFSLNPSVTSGLAMTTMSSTPLPPRPGTEVLPTCSILRLGSNAWNFFPRSSEDKWIVYCHIP
jgi:hypothetical protein